MGANTGTLESIDQALAAAAARWGADGSFERTEGAEGAPMSFQVSLPSQAQSTDALGTSLGRALAEACGCRVAIHSRSLDGATFVGVLDAASGSASGIPARCEEIFDEIEGAKFYPKGWTRSDGSRPTPTERGMDEGHAEKGRKPKVDLDKLSAKLARPRRDLTRALPGKELRRFAGIPEAGKAGPFDAPEAEGRIHGAGAVVSVESKLAVEDRRRERAQEARRDASAMERADRRAAISEKLSGRRAGGQGSVGVAGPPGVEGMKHGKPS